MHNTTSEHALAIGNLTLAILLAKKFSRTCGDFDELKSEAYLALCIAAKHYDPSKGYAFSTFAHRVITNRLLGYYRLCQRPHYYAPQSQTPLDTEALDAALETLSLREAEVLVHKYWDQLPYRVLAQKWNCSRQNVQLVHKATLAKLRWRLSGNRLLGDNPCCRSRHSVVFCASSRHFTPALTG
jgi:RNA polymerase sigma factor (sigma-70 family)